MKDDTNYKKQRGDFEFNHGLIVDAYFAILKEKKGRRKPTLKEIETITSISVTTIRKHLKQLRHEEIADKKDDSLNLLTESVKLSIYQSAIKGNPSSQKLWMQIVAGWNEKTETKVNARVETVNAPPVIIKIE